MISRNGIPVVGFGDPIVVPVAAAASPWGAMFATSVVSAVTGWVLDEVVRSVRKRKKRR